MGIKDFYSDLHGDLSLIAGPNNAGKSTILKAIDYFFSGIETDFPDKYYPKHQYYKDESNRALSTVRLYFDELSAPEKDEYSSILRRDGTFWIEVRATRTGAISFLSSGDKSEAEASHLKLTELFEIIKVDAVRVSRDGALQEETGKLFIVTRDALVKSRRGKIADQRKRLYKAFDESVEVLDSILEKSREYVADALPSKGDIGFEYPESQEILEILLSSVKIKMNEGMDVTIDDEGTGHQSMMSLGLLKYVKEEAKGRPVIFLVEEPEAFLHPHYQRAVAEYLSDLSRGAQVIATTHSTIILDSVSIENIVRVPRSEDGLEYSCIPIDLSDKDIGILNRYCNVKNSEIVFADKIVLCEGLSDFYLIKEIISEFFSENRFMDNVSIIDCDGTAISHIVHLAKVFGIESFVIVDRDSYSGGRETLKKICASMGEPLAASDYRVLDAAKADVVATKSDAFKRRKSVNRIMLNRGLFILSTDVEGSVLASVSRANILRIARDGFIAFKDADALRSLPSESDKNYLTALFSLFGSKGFNDSRGNKDRKPKPHEFAIFAGRALSYVERDSDLYVLKSQLKKFLR